MDRAKQEDEQKPRMGEGALLQGHRRTIAHLRARFNCPVPSSLSLAVSDGGILTVARSLYGET